MTWARGRATPGNKTIILRCVQALCIFKVIYYLLIFTTIYTFEKNRIRRTPELHSYRHVREILATSATQRQIVVWKTADARTATKEYTIQSYDVRAYFHILCTAREYIQYTVPWSCGRRGDRTRLSAVLRRAFLMCGLMSKSTVRIVLNALARVHVNITHTHNISQARTPDLPPNPLGMRITALTHARFPR